MIKLTQMTKPLIHRLLNGFENDPAVFENPEKFVVYQYSPAAAEDYWERQQRLGRIHLAIILHDEPIGEIILKNVESVNRSCSLSIHLKSDSVKNQGYGTKAEILALEYAFHSENMEIVYANALIRNTRSCHVLEKAGFTETHMKGAYRYYECTHTDWHRLNKS